MSWPTKEDAPWLIVGLGNPGPKYETTRHNLGFLALDVIADEARIDVRRARFRGLIGEGRWLGERVVLLKPMTMMNLSGESVREAARYYKIPPEKIFVLYDDFDVPTGQLRIRQQGGSGTHKGMQNIVKLLGSREFPRIRLGCGPLPQGEDVVRYVLAPIPKADIPQINEVLEGAARAVEVTLRDGIDTAMNRYNLEFGKHREGA